MDFEVENTSEENCFKSLTGKVKLIYENNDVERAETARAVESFQIPNG